MRYAIKLLTSSDLTLFAAYYRLNPSSKQKGVNLNGDILAGRMYPTLPTQITGTFELPVTLDLYGPDGASMLRLKRKIIKPEAGKNWRLNGKLIEAPSDDNSRFNDLHAEDIAVFAFDGDPVPTSISMLLLSAGSVEDADIHEYLLSTYSLAPRSRSMVELTPEELARVPVAGSHPVWLLLPDLTRTSDLIAAAEDDDEARERLDTRARSGVARPVSAAELAAAKVRAQEIGRAGEVLYSEHLEREKEARRIEAFEWVADENATSPFDFLIKQIGGHETAVDVKTTTGAFGGTIHISVAELTAAAHRADYRIVRIYNLEGSGGPKVRISDGISDLAGTLLDALAALPVGVRATKFEVRTDVLTWNPAQELSLDED